MCMTQWPPLLSQRQPLGLHGEERPVVSPIEALGLTLIAHPSDPATSLLAELHSQWSMAHAWHERRGWSPAQPLIDCGHLLRGAAHVCVSIKTMVKSDLAVEDPRMAYDRWHGHERTDAIDESKQLAFRGVGQRLVQTYSLECLEICRSWVMT